MARGNSPRIVLSGKLCLGQLVFVKLDGCPTSPVGASQLCTNSTSQAPSCSIRDRTKGKSQPRLWIGRLSHILSRSGQVPWETSPSEALLGKLVGTSSAMSRANIGWHPKFCFRTSPPVGLPHHHDDSSKSTRKAWQTSYVKSAAPTELSLTQNLLINDRPMHWLDPDKTSHAWERCAECTTRARIHVLWSRDSI